MREIKFRAWNKASSKMSLPFGFGDLYGYEGECNSVGLMHPYTSEGQAFVVSQHDGGSINFPQMPAENPDIIIMQFTGLKDKNGKEIYEGDVVREHQKFFIPKEDDSKDMDEIVLDSIGDIRFDNGCFVLFSQTKEQKEAGGSSTACGFGRLHEQVIEGEEYWMEVVGNVHENPELLK